MSSTSRGSRIGTLTLNLDRSFTYTPAARLNDQDRFPCKAHDATDDSEAATELIPVNALSPAGSKTAC